MPVGPEPAAATAVGENLEPPAALDGATRLLLVRHAVTPFTEAGRVDGRGGADPDLSDTGRRQAERAGHGVRDLVDGDVRLVTSSTAAAMAAPVCRARASGESLAQLETRVHRAYQNAVGASGTTVVVTSRKPILVVVALVLGVQEYRFWALSTDPASVTAVELWPDGQVSVPFVNRTSHLD
jgi:ribonuclease H / adenosylcobalamin/alpha-ribazole phosphatase